MVVGVCRLWYWYVVDEFDENVWRYFDWGFICGWGRLGIVVLIFVYKGFRGSIGVIDFDWLLGVV